MLMLIVVLSFVTVFLLVYLLLAANALPQGNIAMRLKALNTMTAGRSDIDEELARPFKERVLSPLRSDFAAALSRFTPRALRRAVEEKMTAAGGFGSLTPDEFLLLSGLFAVAAPAVAATLAALAGAAAHQIVGLSLMAFAGALLLPFFLLNRKIAMRKRSIQKDLPDVLDLLTVSVEAGLGFDGALAKLSEKMKGALVDEFTRALQEMRMGVPRREALRAMGLRCDVPDLSLFTTSLIQADQLGVSIGQVLRVQSASMREKRRQRTQELAMKAPVKMLLPLVFFIFPAIFVVVLGPAIIQIFLTFSQR